MRFDMDEEEQVQDIPHALRAETRLHGKYLLGRVIGAGKFGITYMAYHMELELKLAIKECFPFKYVERSSNECDVVERSQGAHSFEHVVGRFLDEAKRLAQLESVRSVPIVLDFFRANQTAYLVMKYIDGYTLRDYLHAFGGRLSVDETVGIILRLLDAVAEIHRKNVYHRDINPDNIMLRHEDQSIVLIDFGTARSEMDRMLRGYFTVQAKYHYTPPEQRHKFGEQGPWTDIYAVGVTMYELLTGKLPPDSPNLLDGKASLKPLSHYGIDVPKHIECALNKALHLSVKERFKSTAEFKRALLNGNHG